MNILLTCVGRRHYLAKYFKDFVGSQGYVVGTDMTSSAPGLVACDFREVVPAVSSESYINVIMNICNKYNIDFLFSLNDLELEILSKNKSLISSETNATVVISNHSVIDICNDKYETYLFAINNFIPAPKTYIKLDIVKDDLDSGIIEFPLMIKPRWGSASIGLYKATNINELEKYFLLCKQSVHNSVLNDISTSDDKVIIQEFIEGQEYGVDVLNTLDGNYVNFAAKKKISMRAGETDRAETIDYLPFVDSVEKIAVNLKHIGNLDCDFLEKNGIYYLLEMNPRFGGGYPFTHESGANHILHLLGEISGLDIPEYTYSQGLTLSKCDQVVIL